MVTLYRHLVDEAELADPRAFIPRYREWARDLARADGDPGVARSTPAESTVRAWYYGTRRPNTEARRVLTAKFGHSMAELWSPAADVLATTAAMTADAPLHDRTSMSHIREGAAMAARRARDFAMGTERGALGDETLGFLEDEVRDLAQRYPRTPLSEIVDDLVSAQDSVFRYIESGRSKPTQLRQLHVLAALLSWLMAKASHDLGDPASAMMQARTAGVCARQAEHPELAALTDGLKSLITYWSGQSDDARHYARRAAAEHHRLRGTVSVWLPALEARAAAQLEDAEGARNAVARAQQMRTHVVSDELDEIGGLLTFPEERQLYYAVEADVLLGDGAHVERAEQAAAAYEDPAAPHWAFGDAAGTRCNLALTRLHGGDLDGGAAALRPVLDLPPAQRTRGIIISARRVQAALSRPAVRTAALARDLREEIAAYSPTRLTLPPA